MDLPGCIGQGNQLARSPNCPALGSFCCHTQPPDFDDGFEREGDPCTADGAQGQCTNDILDCFGKGRVLKASPDCETFPGSNPGNFECCVPRPPPKEGDPCNIALGLSGHCTMDFDKCEDEGGQLQPSYQCGNHPAFGSGGGGGGGNGPKWLCCY